MRPQLVFSGLLVMLMGGAFYVLQIPLAFAWSIVFVAGGALMSVGGMVASESHGPVQPPEGYRFCRYCSAQVPLGAARCPQCNGLQASEGA
jgi:hypothetical protein